MSLKKGDGGVSPMGVFDILDIYIYIYIYCTSRGRRGRLIGSVCWYSGELLSPHCPHWHKKGPIGDRAAKIVYRTSARVVFRIRASGCARDPSHRAFHPPWKNVNIAVGVKSIPKYWFPRCMRTTKKVFLTEHGKQFFAFDDTSNVKRTLFFERPSREGCKKWKYWAWRWVRSKKNNASHRAWESIFWLLQPL